MFQHLLLFLFFMHTFRSMTDGACFRNVIFPLGKTLKSDVRAIAAKYFEGLEVLSKKESMGICFIGRRSFPEFLSSYIYLTRGNFIDWETGRVVGTHQGKETYTKGQGAKIGGSKYSLNLHHCSFLVNNNCIIIGTFLSFLHRLLE